MICFGKISDNDIMSGFSATIKASNSCFFICVRQSQLLDKTDRLSKTFLQLKVLLRLEEVPLFTVKLGC